jgi:hypothetical protein
MAAIFTLPRSPIERLTNRGRPSMPFVNNITICFYPIFLFWRT